MWRGHSMQIKLWKRFIFQCDAMRCDAFCSFMQTDNWLSELKVQRTVWQYPRHSLNSIKSNEIIRFVHVQSVVRLFPVQSFIFGFKAMPFSVQLDEFAKASKAFKLISAFRNKVQSMFCSFNLSFCADNSNNNSSSNGKPSSLLNRSFTLHRSFTPNNVNSNSFPIYAIFD